MFFCFFLEIKFVFSSFQKITVGGFVNQLIKAFWHTSLVHMAYVNSEGLDKLTQTCSLVKDYAARTHKMCTQMKAQTKLCKLLEIYSF